MEKWDALHSRHYLLPCPAGIESIEKHLNECFLSTGLRMTEKIILLKKQNTKSFVYFPFAPLQHQMQIFNYIDTIIVFIIPFTTIVVLNTFTAVAVWKVAGIRRTMIVQR